jgi:5-formyltetrahydrofolate cyclo-ligase
MNKSELRKKLLAQRHPDAQKDRMILHNLLSLKEFIEADLILSYISTKNEINTYKLFGLGRSIAAPKTHVHDITFYELPCLADTCVGKYNIREPLETCVPAQISGNTFCVVPALACDEHGFRIGFGRGYYDRFLKDFAGVSAALCYIENIVSFAVEPHDVAVDYIITEGGIIRGRQNGII